MNSCSMCGSSIPDEQRVCSMCYGDIDYGKDGYYREWAEHQNQEEQRQKEDEEEYYKRVQKGEIENVEPLKDDNDLPF